VGILPHESSTSSRATGASGIGLATARRFVAEDARVVIGDVNVDALAAVVAELG